MNTGKSTNKNAAQVQTMRITVAIGFRAKNTPSDMWSRIGAVTI